MDHPADIKTVVYMLHACRLDEYKRARDFLNDLLEHGLINAAEAEPVREYAIQRLQTAFDITAPKPTEVVERRETVETVTASPDSVRASKAERTEIRTELAR